MSRKIKPGILANLNGEEHLTAVLLSEHFEKWLEALSNIALRCEVMLIGAYFGICCHPLFWHLCPHTTLISRKKLNLNSVDYSDSLTNKFQTSEHSFNNPASLYDILLIFLG